MATKLCETRRRLAASLYFPIFIGTVLASAISSLLTTMSKCVSRVIHDENRKLKFVPAATRDWDCRARADNEKATSGSLSPVKVVSTAAAADRLFAHF